MPNVIEILIKAKDQASKQIQALGKQVNATADSLRKIGFAATAAGGAISGAMALSVKSAVDFQKGMADVATLVDESKVSMQSLADAVLRISTETGKPLSDVTQALYKVTSAGYEGADAIKFLEVAGKTAVAGVSSLTDSVDVLRTMLASYNLSADQAAMVSDKLFKLVDQGIPTFGEWASSIGRVAGTAAQAGVPMDEMLAALATMSKTAPSAAQATTELAAVISSIINPTDQALKAAAEYGIQLDASALATKGLSGVLADLEKAIGGNVEALGEIFTEQEAFRGVQRLLAGDMKDFSQTLDSMRDSVGAADQAFQKQSETVSFLLSKIRALAQKGMVELGSSILPLVKDALSSLLSVLEKVVGFFSNLPAPLQKFIAIATAVAGAIAGITGAALVLLPQLVAFGQAIAAVAPLLAGLAGPIGIAVAAIGGLATAVVLLIKYFDQVKAGAKGFVNGMKSLFSSLGNWFKSLFSSIGDVFMGFLKMLTIKGAKAGIEQMKKGFAGIGDAVSQAFQQAADVAVKTGEAVASGATNLVKGVKDEFSKLMDGLKGKEEETSQAIESSAKRTAGVKIQADQRAAGVSKRLMEQRLKMALENFKFEAAAHNMSIEEQIQALDRMRDEYSAYPDLVQKVDEQIIKLQGKLQDEILSKIEALKEKRAEATQAWLSDERTRISEIEGVYGKYSAEVISRLQNLYTQAEALSADYYGSEENRQKVLADLTEEINRRKAGALREFVSQAKDQIKEMKDSEEASLTDIAAAYQNLFYQVASMRDEDVGGAEEKIGQLKTIYSDFISFLEERYREASDAFERHNSKIADLAASLNDELKRLTLDETEYKRQKLEEWYQQRLAQIEEEVKKAKDAQQQMLQAVEARYQAEMAQETALFEEKRKHLEAEIGSIQAQQANIDQLVQAEIQNRLSMIELEYQQKKALIVQETEDRSQLAEKLKALEDERLAKVQEVSSQEDKIRSQLKDQLLQKLQDLKDQAEKLEAEKSSKVQEILQQEQEARDQILQQAQVNLQAAEEAKAALTQVYEAKRTQIVQKEEEKRSEEARKQFQEWKNQLQILVDDEKKRGGDILKITRDFWAQRLSEVQAGTEAEREIKNQLFDAEVDLNKRILEQVNALKDRDRQAALEMLQNRLQTLKAQYPEWTALHDAIISQIKDLQSQQMTIGDQLRKYYEGLTGALLGVFSDSFDKISASVSDNLGEIIDGSISMKDGLLAIVRTIRDESTSLFDSLKEAAVEDIKGIAADETKGALDSLKAKVLDLISGGFGKMASFISASVLPLFPALLGAISPLLPVLAAVAAGAAALYAAWKWGPDLLGKIRDAFNRVREKMEALGKKLAEHPALLGALAVAFAPVTAAVIGLKVAFEALKVAFDVIKDTASALLDLFQDVFVDAWEGIKGGFKAALDWIVDKFSFFKEKISVVAEALGRAIGAPFRALSAVLDPVLDVLRSISSIFDKVGGVVKDILGAIGGGVKELLGLQHGGLVMGPTPAIVGEGGPELVIPLDRLKGLGGGQKLEVHFHVGAMMGNEAEAMEFARMIERFRNQMLLRRGAM